MWFVLLSLGNILSVEVAGSEFDFFFFPVLNLRFWALTCQLELCGNWGRKGLLLFLLYTDFPHEHLFVGARGF